MQPRPQMDRSFCRLIQLVQICWFLFLKRKKKNVGFVSCIAWGEEASSHAKANQTRSFVAISGGREWTGARPADSPIMCCVNSGPVYPCTTINLPLPIPYTTPGPVGSGLCHCQEPGGRSRYFFTGAGTCCHTRRLLSEQSPRCLSHGHCIARDIPHIHSSMLDRYRSAQQRTYT